jgi:hypothetical protein
MTQETSQNNISSVDDDDQRTLADYVIFLQNNGFNREADFYLNDVCNLLKTYGSSSCQYPLQMMTKDVIANLYLINDALQAAASSLKSKGDVWDIELRS